MTDTEARAQAKLRVRVEARRRERLSDRVEVARMERFSLLACVVKGCLEPTSFVVALKGVQRAVCADHGAEACCHGRLVVPVEAFLPAEL